MKKKTAIKVLKLQKEKLDRFQERRFYDKVWKTQTTQYIKQIFGENSEQFYYISGIKIHNQFSPDPTSFLDSCIDTVNNTGVYKEPKKNFLSMLPDSIVVLILSTIGFIAFGFGKYISDVNNIELKRENKSLRDSISVVKSLEIPQIRGNYNQAYNTKDSLIQK